MMRSLFSGVSALRNHQIRMDVIGNNIANVNTVGFKSSRVTFREVLNQTIKAASSPQGGRGGVNPIQIGLGMALGSIDVIHSQGSPEVTGRQTDMAIEGDGFFILSDGSRYFYTRAGLFGVDKDGSLVSTVNGMKVMGYKAVNGQVDPKGGLTSLVIPVGATIKPIATSTVKFSGNLDSRMDWEWKLLKSEFTLNSQSYSARVEKTDEFGKWTLKIVDSYGKVVLSEVVLQDGDGLAFVDPTSRGTTPTKEVKIGGVRYSLEIAEDGLTIRRVGGGGGSETKTTLPASLERPQVTQTVDVFDSLGNTHAVSFVLTKVGVNTWQWKATCNVPGFDGGEGEIVGEIVFDSTGAIESITGDPLVFTPVGADTVQIMPDFTALVQNAAEGTLVFESQDGYPQGTLVGFSVDEAGNIIGEYSNGLTEVLGQIAIAVFNNPAGLAKAGDTTFVVSANSGEPKVGQPGTGSRGKIIPGSLEMSNVDLSQEFTDMIITQRGFQANSRIITTSDEMLQELVNLKR
ncbi:MAG TPA: flagellar hook protein FlgE [Firmicutes bacterium]|nr:flagellar hook protein FlgE [Bacillota bacterium]